MLRTLVCDVAQRCPTLGSKADAVYAVEPKRGRSASMAAIGKALAVIAADPQLPTGELQRVGEHLFAWLLSLCPMPEQALSCAWETETRSQASADVAQARALRALETLDFAALDTAIIETTAHTAAQQLLTARLLAAKRTVNATPRRAVRVLTSHRQIAAGRDRKSVV